MNVSKVQRAWSVIPFVISLAVLAVIVTYVLTDGLFDIGRTVQFGDVFPEMWTRLLHLDVTANPETIGGEAFVVGDKRIAYFLPLPALVRGILSLVGLGHSAVLSVAIGAVVFAACSGWLFRLALKILTPQVKIPNSIQAAWLTFFVLCSPILALIASARVYWEALVWAAAMFMVCASLSLFTLLKPTSLTRWLWLSIACGLALFTRPNTAVGVILLFGLTLLVARFKFPTLTRLRSLTWSSVIFCFFLVLLGTLNYARWGDPLEFAPLHQHIGLIGTERGANAEKYGNFRLDRVPGAFSYYFLPSTDNLKPEKPYVKSGYSNYFSEVEKYIDYREETYPISIALPVFLVLSLLGSGLLVYQAIHSIRRKSSESTLVYFLPLAATAWIPGLLLLPLPSQMVRYMGDFFPGIVFFAILASVFLLKRLYTKSEPGFLHSPLGQGVHVSVVTVVLIGSFYLLVGTSIYQKILWTVSYDQKFFPFW